VSQIQQTPEFTSGAHALLEELRKLLDGKNEIAPVDADGFRRAGEVIFRAAAVHNAKRRLRSRRSKQRHAA